MWERPFDKLRTGFSREPFGCVTGDPEKLAA
jgi:hypothetical protein